MFTCKDLMAEIGDDDEMIDAYTPHWAFIKTRYESRHSKKTQERKLYVIRASRFFYQVPGRNSSVDSSGAKGCVQVQSSVFLYPAKYWNRWTSPILPWQQQPLSWNTATRRKRWGSGQRNHEIRIWRHFWINHYPTPEHQMAAWTNCWLRGACLPNSWSYAWCERSSITGIPVQHPVSYRSGQQRKNWSAIRRQSVPSSLNCSSPTDWSEPYQVY